MAHRRQPLHLVRSVIARNWLQSRGVELATVKEALASRGHLDAGVLTRRALALWWGGKRPLRFDPPGGGTPLSEVHLLEQAFEGFGYVFFHPLFNLLARPLRSTEAYLARHAGFSAEVMEGELIVSRSGPLEMRALARTRLAHMQRVNARAALSHRHREAHPSAPAASLRGIYQVLLQLRSPLRDELMQPARRDVEGVEAIDIGWVRRARSLDDELRALARSPRLDRLAAAVGLVTEAAHTGREECSVRLEEFLHQETKALANDPLFAGVSTTMAVMIRTLPPCPPVLEIDLIEAQLAALPQSWADRLLSQR